MPLKTTKKERLIDIKDFSKGLVVLEDSTKAPLGSAREMQNMWITDRKGLSKRPGTLLVGSNSTGGSSLGFYNYTKHDGSEVLMRSYDDEIEYYHSTSVHWARLEDGFTTGSEFGFKEHNVNTDSEDYVYFCNRTEDYRRWSAPIATNQSALSSNGTTLTVDTVLYSDVMYDGSVSAGTASSIDIGTTGTWATDQWNSTFYLYVTSTGHANKISQIQDTLTSGIEFTALSSSITSGTTFQIRKPKFPSSGTLVIDGSDRTYSAMPTYQTFTVSSGVAAASGTPVTLKPTTYPQNPRGNRFDTHYTRMYVGNVRSAMQKNASSSQIGFYGNPSVFASKLGDATDYTFTVNRTAKEGDIISAAYAKGQITDVASQEDRMYMFAKNYIEGFKYSQDGNDLLERDSLSMDKGSINKVIKTPNDIMFVTDKNEINSIGRVVNKDTRPSITNLGYKVKREIADWDFSATAGITHLNRLYINGMQDNDKNNRVLVYNNQTQGFEGVWTLGAYGFGVSSGELLYADSQTPNVYQMLTGYNDTQGSNTFGITGIWKSNFLNLTPSGGNQQALNCLGVQGYIRGNTTIKFSIYKNQADTAALEFTFGGSEEDFLTKTDMSKFLGSNPLGLQPLGTVSQATDGRFHFRFLVYFPYQYGNFFSLGVNNSGTDQDFEITRFSLALKEDTIHDINSIKTI